MIFIQFMNPVKGSYSVSLGFRHIASNKTNPNENTSAFIKTKPCENFLLNTKGLDLKKAQSIPEKVDLTFVFFLFFQRQGPVLLVKLKYLLT